MKGRVCAPILSFVLVSLGGLLLHIRFHPPGEDLEDLVPLILGLISVLVLPFLLYSRKGSLWAYLITWITAIVGTIAMANWSVQNWQGELTFVTFFLNSTFPDICILFAKVPLAYAIMRMHRSAAEEQESPVESLSE